MTFTLFGGRLGLLRGGLSLESIMCLNFEGSLLRDVVGKAGSGGGVRSDRLMGCTYNQLQDN